MKTKFRCGARAKAEDSISFRLDSRQPGASLSLKEMKNTKSDRANTENDFSRVVAGQNQQDSNQNAKSA